MRIVAFDYLKGVAIFLVVWCHCIQYIVGETFDNTFYSIVYSFHMPLFMIISGYLFSKKLGGNLGILIGKQFKRLIIPNMVWGSIVLIMTTMLTTTPPELLKIFRLPFSCWFLSSLFLSSIVYAISYKLGVRSSVLSVILLSFLSILLPGNEFIKYFIPFFGIGLIFAQKDLINHILKWPYIIIFGCVIVAFYLLFWSREFYVYCTPNPSLYDLRSIKWVAYFARILFGTSISVWFMFFIRKLDVRVTWLKKFLIQLSHNSLGIYVIHYSCFTMIKDSLQIHICSYDIVIVVAMFLLTLMVIFIMNVVIRCLRANGITKMLFLGEM